MLVGALLVRVFSLWRLDKAYKCISLYDTLSKVYDMKAITQLIVKKYVNCCRCGREETNPEEISIPLKNPITFDEKNNRIEIIYLVDNNE